MARAPANLSSPELSSPPSVISPPGSPPRVPPVTSNPEMDEIIVGAKSANVGTGPDGKPVQLTAAGLPRKKPGRKPGTTVKPKTTTEGGQEAPKQKRQRKPKDPNAPPVQRKRKSAPHTEANVGTDSKSLASASGSLSAPPTTTTPPSGPTRQAKITDLVSAAPQEPDASGHPDFPVKAPKREPYVSSMQNILNATDVPVRTSGQVYDPIRGNYDPVRETMISRDPYGTNSVSSPRPPQVTNRASASPSISILVDPMPNPSPVSPPQLSRQSSQQHQPSAPPLRAPTTEGTSMPPSPSPNPPRTSLPPPLKPPPPAPPSTDRKPVPSAGPTNNNTTKPEARKENGIATISKKPSPKQKPNTAASSPKTKELEDPPAPASGERSILDFGRARPGEEFQAPTIVLEIPISPGETNKYVNFMRLAEERYGWDALHPRLAVQRDRKARIAAAASALEKNGSGRESGDEMSEDVSDNEGGSADHPGGVASGADVPAKPARKKRNFKEDEYDRDDDFVDDSELMWEEHAAASRDGFFVYSGPLIREAEKQAASYVFPHFLMFFGPR